MKTLKAPAIILFYKMDNSTRTSSWKEQNISVSTLIFHRKKKYKIVLLFVNASRLGEKLKKMTIFHFVLWNETKQKHIFLLFSTSRINHFIKSRIAGTFHWFAGPMFPTHVHVCHSCKRREETVQYLNIDSLKQQNLTIIFRIHLKRKHVVWAF